MQVRCTPAVCAHVLPHALLVFTQLTKQLAAPSRACKPERWRYTHRRRSDRGRRQLTSSGIEHACALQRSTTCVYITASETPLGNCCSSLISSHATKLQLGSTSARYSTLPCDCALCSFRAVWRSATHARCSCSAPTTAVKAAMLHYRLHKQTPRLSCACLSVYRSFAQIGSGRQTLERRQRLLAGQGWSSVPRKRTERDRQQNIIETG